MEPAAPATNGTTVFIRNQFNSCLTRFGCTLCGGATEKQSYLFWFRLPDSDDNGIACDRCAENPQDIAVYARQQIQCLKQRIADLEFLAGCTYVTEVVPAPEDVHNEDEFRPWMRKRLGLPFRYAENADGEPVWLP